MARPSGLINALRLFYVASAQITLSPVAHSYRGQNMPSIATPLSPPRCPRLSVAWGASRLCFLVRRRRWGSHRHKFLFIGASALGRIYSSPHAARIKQLADRRQILAPTCLPDQLPDQPEHMSYVIVSCHASTFFLSCSQSPLSLSQLLVHITNEY